jgi:hypothetical protein
MTIGRVPFGVAGVSKYVELGLLLFGGIPPVA